MRALPLLCGAVLFLACHGQPTADRLSDGQAKEIIEDWLASPSAVRLGSLTVVNGDPKWEKGEINLITLQITEAWAKAGVVAIAVPKDLTQGFTGWNDWMAHWGEGVEKTIMVTPTDRGRSFEVVRIPSGGQYLKITGTSGNVHKIVQNEAIKKGADVYRLLSATYAVQHIPEKIAYLAARGFPQRSTEKKCRLLLSWDPFKQVWSVTGAEEADADSEFSTINAFEDILH
jgi:hypothetical protein